VLVAYAATCALWTPMLPLTDAYALRGVARYGLNYGPMRLWGSAAFVAGALICGLLVDIVAAKHLIWVIASIAALGAVASLGLQPLERPKPAPAAVQGASPLLRDWGFVAIIVASALTQGSHAAYYAFASITWQGLGLGGLTIAGLWVLGVLAEIVVFALSPRFTLQPSALVVIGALSAVARWSITAQEPSLAVLSGRIQAVVATPIVFTHDSNSSSASAGVFQPRVFLGRALRAAATAAIRSALWTLRSVPFGKY
jgi:PPP family 3-phenylpropionic acid transporter